MIGRRERKRLKQFAKNLQKTSSKLTIDTSVLTPLNYSSEKQKFLQNTDTYNPQFIYPKKDTADIKKEAKELETHLHELVIPQELKLYIHEYLKTLKDGVALIDSIGSPEFAHIANGNFQFEKTDTKDFLHQMSSLSFNEPPAKQLHCADEMKEIFLDYFAQLGIEDFEIHIDHFNDHIVRVGRNRLVIGSQVKRFCNNVQRLIVHEIESHVLQRYNMANTQNPLLRLIPHRESLLWGEGLAVYNEIESGSITRSAYETYYYRLKAVEMLEKSFKDIFEYLVRFVPAEKAFMIAYRVKRGMGDTGNPGGYPKDASYLLGYKKVTEFIENGGSIEFLYMSRYPKLGELLFQQELLEVGTIALPSYLRKQKSAPLAQPITSSILQ